MTRLIDADALDYLTHRECAGHGEYYDMEIVTKVRIDNAPTIDAVEVVRCKDCICREIDECPMYWEEWSVGEGGDDLRNVHDYTRDDGFCDWGERREP